MCGGEEWCRIDGRRGACGLLFSPPPPPPPPWIAALRNVTFCDCCQLGQSERMLAVSLPPSLRIFLFLSVSPPVCVCAWCFSSWVVAYAISWWRPGRGGGLCMGGLGVLSVNAAAVPAACSLPVSFRFLLSSR